MDSLSRTVASMGQWTLAATYMVVAVAAWRQSRRPGSAHISFWAGASLCAGLAHSATRGLGPDPGMIATFGVLVATMWHASLMVSGARRLRGAAVDRRQAMMQLGAALAVTALTTLTTLPLENEHAGLVLGIVSTTAIAAGLAASASMIWTHAARRPVRWAHALVAVSLLGHAALSILALAIRTGQTQLPVGAIELFVLPEWGLLLLVAFGVFAAENLHAASPSEGARATEVRHDWAARMGALRLLSGKVAHDINNALTAIKGNVEWVLQSDKLGEPHRQALEDVTRASARGNEVTTSLRAMFDPAPARETVDDLNAIARATAQRLRSRETDAARIRLELTPEPCGVRCAAGRLARLIELLAERAVAVAATDATVTIRTERIDADGSVALTVLDTGPALDTAAIDALFDPFVEGLAKPGLTEVWTTATQSKGRIEARSSHAEGTRIRIGWPHADTPVLLPASPSQARRSVQGPFKILLAEDDEPVRAHAVRALTQAGHRVTPVADGVEATSELERDRYDVVITDVRMPHRDGIELASLIRERQPELPVLLISGYVGAEQAAILDLPLLHKPFTGRELLEFLDASTGSLCHA